MGKPDVPRVCEHCRTPFLAYRTFVNKGRARFCTIQCVGKAEASKRRERLFEKIEKTDGCWFWTGRLDEHGYGVVTLSSPKRTGRVHRMIWEMERGPIPEGLSLLHACDTPRCVNPGHLSIGTQRDNMADAKRKGRMAVGAQHGGARLSDADVLQIRALGSSGRYHYDIAKDFGVSKGQISHIIAGKGWRHI